MPQYEPNIPTGLVNLDVDYQNLRNNFQEINTVYLIDHVAMTDTSAQKGFHKAVHMVQRGSDPGATGDVGIVFCKKVNDGINDSQILYFKNDLGKIGQLTRNFTPKKGQNGYTYLPGGLIMQWGFKSASFVNGGVTNSVTLATSNINFPNNCYVAYGNPVNQDPGSITSNNCAVVPRNLGLTQIQFVLTAGSTGPATLIGYNWWALGD